MANKIYLNSTFGYREDTLKNWQTANPVLEKGELSFVRDGFDGKFVKIGDGHTKWNDLSFAPLPKGEKGEKGKPGGDYVLTEADKTEIADKAKTFIDQAYNPESQNAQSGIAVAEALADSQKQWTLLHDKTLEQTVAGITLTTNCKEVYLEGTLILSDENIGKTTSVFLQTSLARLAMFNVSGNSITETLKTVYVRGGISVAPNGRLKGLLSCDTNRLGYSKTPIESTLSTSFANADGLIEKVAIQCSTMEAGSNIKIWGVL